MENTNLAGRSENEVQHRLACGLQRAMIEDQHTAPNFDTNAVDNLETLSATGQQELVRTGYAVGN